MAKLSDLKWAMGTSIFAASFIFGIFLLAVIFLLQYYVVGFDLLTGLILAIARNSTFHSVRICDWASHRQFNHEITVRKAG